MTLAHEGPGLCGLYILVPNFLRSVFLSSANSFLNLLMSVCVLLSLAGALTTLTNHPISFLSCWMLVPFCPTADLGSSASIVTSDKAGSSHILLICASEGIILDTASFTSVSLESSSE